MKIAIILGTRPEIIKNAPIIRECIKRNLSFYVLHTGQHYDYTLDRKIFEDLEIPFPKYNLGVGGKPYRMQIGNMIDEIATILKKDSPDYVVVQGDTNSVLAGALAANKLGIRVAHLEAGLRSHDLTMFEETNRIIVDHVSDTLLAATEEGVGYLESEGILFDKIFKVGNTIADAVLEHSKIASIKSQVLDKLGLKEKAYILVTVHRAENVDSEQRFRKIIKGLELVANETGLRIMYSAHPRAVNKIKQFDIEIPNSIEIIEPLGYLDFLELQRSSRIVLTDSGGLQEETNILNIPCVTLRDNTERQETIDAGTNVLAGVEPGVILEKTREMFNKEMPGYKNLYGKGDAAKKSIDILLSLRNTKNKTMEKGEIKKFYSAYSDQITNKRYNSEYPLRSYAHKKQYEGILEKVKPGDRVLDAGCGEGTLSILMAKKGVSVVGVDISKPNIANAKEYARKEGVEVVFDTADLENLPFDNSSFDLVVSSHVLEHLPDFDRGLKEIMRVTKKEAIVAIPTILNPCSWVQVGGGMFWLKGIRSFAGLFIGFLRTFLALLLSREGVNESYVGSGAPHVFRFPSVMHKKANKHGFKVLYQEASSICIPYFSALLPLVKWLDRFKGAPVFRNFGYGTTYVISKEVDKSKIDVD